MLVHSIMILHAMLFWFQWDLLLLSQLDAFMIVVMEVAAAGLVAVVFRTVANNVL